ncbi:MAG: MFS transporter, partial [Deltaproteobacteria bacterium]|nr:MFS transporter [Deltaproteobacteria bacterium]
MKKFPRLPFYYGWLIVAVSFVTLGLSFGVWYSFSVFFVAIIRDFGWERAATASIFSFFVITHYLSATGAGILVDRYGPRWVIPAGAAILAAALLLSSRAASLPQFYLTYGVGAAVGISLMGFVPHATLLPRWFARRRGLAVGLAMAGIGVGMLFIPPGMQRLIAAHGWRQAYVVLALLMLPAIPLNLFCQRRDPAAVGERPDGEQDPAAAAAAKNTPSSQLVVVDREWAATEWTAARALGTRRFWLLAAGFFCGPFAIQGTLLHTVACLVDHGIRPQSAAAIFGLLGICGAVGKVLLGFLADRWLRETASSIGMAAASTSLPSASASATAPWRRFSPPSPPTSSRAPPSAAFSACFPSSSASAAPAAPGSPAGSSTAPTATTPPSFLSSPASGSPA